MTESDGLVPSLPESPSADHDGLPDRGKLSAASSEPRSGAGLPPVGLRDPLGQPGDDSCRARGLRDHCDGLRLDDRDDRASHGADPGPGRAVRLGDCQCDGGRVRAVRKRWNFGSLNGQDRHLQLDSE